MTTPATFGSEREALVAATKEFMSHAWISLDARQIWEEIINRHLSRISPPPATAQGWVSVKDRLPELWTDVMVIIASHSDQIYPRHLLRNDTGTWEDEWGHLFEGMDPESTVLAWRALPEPPPPEHKP